MAIVLLGIREAMASFGKKIVAGRAAATGTTHASAAAAIAALKARAPVGTGQLRNSIGTQDTEETVASSTVSVGASVAHDVYYQRGTTRQPARPYTEDVAEVVDTAVARIASSLFRKAVG